MKKCESCGMILSPKEVRLGIKYTSQIGIQVCPLSIIKGFYNEEDQNKNEDSVEYFTLCENCFRRSFLRLGKSEDVINKFLKSLHPIDVVCEFKLEED